MSIVPGHKELFEETKNLVTPWRKLIIGIDGLPGSGKSNVGRFLAAELDMPCLHTDMFIIAGNSHPNYRYSELKSAIESRLDKDWPLIVEGVFLLDVLGKLGLKADYLVFTQNDEANPGLTLKQSLPSYLAEFKPEEKADFLFDTNFIENGK